MRFLVDECTGPRVARWLREQGHDVFSVYDDERGADDSQVLSRAVSENRILVTNDKDFGSLIFREKRTHHGVVLLRLDDDRSECKIDSIKRLLLQFSDRLEDHFIVVTETKIRISGKLE